MNNTDTASEKRVLNTPNYRRKIKRMVESVKTLRGLDRKIMKGSPRTLSPVATQKQKEVHAAVENSRLTLDVIHYFANPLARSFSKEQTSTEQSSTIDSAPTSQQKK